MRSLKNKFNYADHSHIFLKNPDDGKVYAKIAISNLPNQSVLHRLSSQGSSESLILTLDPNDLDTSVKIEAIDTEEDLIHYRELQNIHSPAQDLSSTITGLYFVNFKKLVLDQ